MSGATTAWGIAQLVTPTDAITRGPNIIATDWQRGYIYYFMNAAGGGVRRYRWALETQNPDYSAPGSSGLIGSGNIAGADIDPITGHIITQYATDVSGGVNCQPIFKLDHGTLAVLGQYGVYTSVPNWPTAFLISQKIVCVECNGVGYAVLKETVSSGTFNVFRVSNTMNHAGFRGNLTGSTNNRCVMTAGASGATGGSIFATWQNLQYSATVPLYTIRIAPGAETYNPATWPATNPHISDATVGNVAASAIDPAWTTMAVAAMGYDQQDGNVLLRVNTNTSGATHTDYLVKVSATTAAVLWSVAMNDLPQLWSYNIRGGEAGFLGDSHKDAISMQTGAMVTLPLSGVALGSFGGIWTGIWDRTSGWYFVNAAPYTQGTGTPTPVSGTPTNFTDFAIMGPVPAPPGQTPKLWLLRQPELHFIGTKT